jgi:hypothetical protein
MLPKSEYTPAVQAAVDHPGDWATVEDFMQWFMSRGMPLAIPWNAEVTMSDDATAICIYRNAQYQVELYIIHPGEIVQMHGHPGLEVVTMTLGGGRLGERQANGLSSMWGEYTPTLREGQVHGGREIGATSIGHALLSFQKWADGLEVLSASTQWRGRTAGPKQEALILKRNPFAVAQPGYADITRRRPPAVL